MRGSASKCSSLTVVCAANGLDPKTVVKQGGEGVEKLEVFQLQGLYDAAFLEQFTGLVELCLMQQQGLSRLDTLQACPMLQRVWLTECELRSAEMLSSHKHLNEVYLCGNALTTIPDLSNSESLHTLWCCDNAITSLSIAGKLQSLQTLWAAGNQIERIDHTMEGLSRLKDLNLAGNLIDGFQDLFHLTRLPELTQLSLRDPHFGPNPVCSLHNYQTYLLYNFPRVCTLDGGTISNDLRLVTEATFAKKRMYYNMRIKTIQAQAHEALTQATELFNKHVARGAIRQNVLMRKLQAVVRELEEDKAYAPKSQPRGDKWKSAENSLQQLLCLKQLELERFESAMAQMRRRVMARRDEQEEALRMELETGGNARLIQGCSSDAWFKACADLFRNRFDAKMYAPHGIRDIRIRGVRRIVNRFLRFKFDRQVEKHQKAKDRPLAEAQFEYLIFIADGHLEHLTVAQRGFAVEDASGCVCLTEGLCAAELSGKSPPLPKAQCCVLTKVYSLEGPGDQEETKDSDMQSRAWNVCDTALLLPEYIVDLEYLEVMDKVRESAIASPSIPQNLQVSRPDFADLMDEFARQIKACVGLPVSLPFSEDELPPARKKIEHISAVSLRAWTFTRTGLDLNNLEYLNLHDAGLHTLEGIACCPRLQTLVVCFNELSDLQGVGALTHLRTLDAGHNVIKRLDGLEDLVFLKQVKLNNNLIYRTDGLEKLDMCVPTLTSMDLRSNPIGEIKNLRAMIIERMGNLTRLDGKPVSKEERQRVMEEHLSTNAELFLKHGKDHYGAQVDASRMEMIEEVSIQHGRLRSLADLNTLPRLRRLNLDDNELSGLAGVERCTSIEELSVAENKICKIEHLDRLISLQKLDLGFNKITQIEGLSGLANLSQLCLEGNEIHSLVGLDALPNLAEVYLAGNQLADLKQVRALRKLKKLTILDLSDNPLAHSSTSRLYTVFCLRGLKILDGIGISQEEQERAKTKYHGKLTKEILEEKLSGRSFEEIQALDLKQCRIASIANGCLDGARFSHLTSINLSGNRLSTLDGFTHLPNIHRLVLAQNHIEEISASKMGQMENLRDLVLDGNRINDMGRLGLDRLPHLERLSLEGNEISHLTGLDGCAQIKELNLDRNRIRTLEGVAYMLPEMDNLQTLRLESNYIRTLGVFHHQPGIHSLFLAHNRINDFLEVDKLHSLKHLLQLTLHNNPVTRKPHYRARAVKNIPTLTFLDSLEVTPNEREDPGKDRHLHDPNDTEQVEAQLAFARLDQEDKDREDGALELGVQGNRLSRRSSAGKTHHAAGASGFARFIQRPGSLSNNGSSKASSSSSFSPILMTRIEGVRLNANKKQQQSSLQSFELPDVHSKKQWRAPARAPTGRRSMIPMRKQRQLLFSPK